ncbi:hypothetical protein [Priestia sp. YIM B13490]|uniref:hypothetical protein n=1 Tax=Priestia sp. YIM B13490 TaxID=3366310 RepID=UPI0036714BC7
MESLSKARKEYPRFFDFLFKSPLYKKYYINTEVMTRPDQETFGYNYQFIDGVEEKVPDIVHFTTYLDNIDFYTLKAIILHPYEQDYYCPFCKKEIGIRNKNAVENSDYLKREIDTIDNFSLREHEDYIDELKSKESKDRYDRFIEEFFGSNHTLNLELECNSKYKHQFVVSLKVEDNKILKIGQYPSIYMFDTSLDKYKKVLKDKKNKTDLRKAIELGSSGYFVGAYTHLRRIFERIVNGELDRLISGNYITYSDETPINNLSTVDKAKLIMEYLPKHLNDIRAPLYSVLSEGIHKLEEKECEKYYNYLLEAITIILEQQLEMREREIKEDENKRKINKANSEIHMKS